MTGHIDLRVSIPPKYSVAHATGLLKSKSASEAMSFGTRNSRMVRGHTLWARGYCVSSVSLEEETVREHIGYQEKADRLRDEADVQKQLAEWLAKALLSGEPHDTTRSQVVVITAVSIEQSSRLIAGSQAGGDLAPA